MNIETTKTPIDEDFHPSNHHSLEFRHVINKRDPEDQALLRRMQFLEEEWGHATQGIPFGILEEYQRLATSLTPTPNWEIHS